MLVTVRRPSTRAHPEEVSETSFGPLEPDINCFFIMLTNFNIYSAWNMAVEQLNYLNFCICAALSLKNQVAGFEYGWPID